MSEFGTAVILAGGKSCRMGFDKQLLCVKQKTLFKVLLPNLRARFSDILVITNTPELYENEGVRTASDIYCDMGPLGGIHAALSYGLSDKVFVIACDMPRIDLAYIDYQMSQLKNTDYDACVTVGGKRFQSFHAFYCKTALPMIEKDLSQNKASMFYLLKEINTRFISEQEAKAVITVPQLFLNLNTKEDYHNFLLCEERA